MRTEHDNFMRDLTGFMSRRQDPLRLPEAYEAAEERYQRRFGHRRYSDFGEFFRKNKQHFSPPPFVMTVLHFHEHNKGKGVKAAWESAEADRLANWDHQYPDMKPVFSSFEAFMEKYWYWFPGEKNPAKVAQKA